MSHATVGLEANDLSQFQEWATKFNKKPSSAYLADGALFRIRPVSELLEDVKKKTLAKGTHDQLVQNILYACFKAAHAKDPEIDEAAECRKVFEYEFKSMLEHNDDVVRVLNYLDEHPKMANRAMAHAGPSGANRRHPVTESIRSKLNDLRAILAEYENGLGHISEKNHFAHITAHDFRYGPFDFGLDLFSADPKGMAFNQTGLIFHLAYLFRYFTSKEPPPPGIDIGRVILDVNGIMLSSGQPHHALVAPLVNAVFKTALNAPDVKYRLFDLYRFSKGSIAKAKWPKVKRTPIFVGWT